VPRMTRLYKDLIMERYSMYEHLVATWTRRSTPPTRSRRPDLKCSNENECIACKMTFYHTALCTLAQCSISRVLHEMSEIIISVTF
jgi:hypothetical protein